MKKLYLLSLTLVLIVYGAQKERAWKIGRVLDSNTVQQSFVTGAVTNTNASASTTGMGSATTSGSATTIGNTTTGSSTTSGAVMANTSAQSTSTTTVQRVIVQTNELLIVGDEYLYLIQDSRRKGGPLIATALANRKHGCRFVVGEDIKYSQEKGNLWVVDADGKECKAEILRQEKKNIQATK